MKLSPYQRVADALLRKSQGKSLPEFVLGLADEGASPPEIARRLRDVTEAAVDVTPQAIRNWIEQFREHSDDPSPVGGAA